VAAVLIIWMPLQAFYTPVDGYFAQPSSGYFGERPGTGNIPIPPLPRYDFSG
jgi:hypothetical protein